MFELSRETDVHFIAVYVLSAVNTCSPEIRLNNVHKFHCYYTLLCGKNTRCKNVLLSCNNIRSSALQERTSLKKHASALQELIYFWQERVARTYALPHCRNVLPS
jgi:hypothetical protein